MSVTSQQIVNLPLEEKRALLADLLKKKSQKPKVFPMSFAQQRLWFLDQLEPESPFYNIPVAVRLKGALDIPALEQTFSEIVRRHEVLRTSFSVVGGQPVQVINPPSGLRVPLIDLSEMGEDKRETEARRLAAEEARRPFDLSRGPLLRVNLLRLSAEDHVLLWTIHHIISDGWSMGVLIKEVAILYQAFSAGEESPLTELAIQYADFAVWQREWLQGEVLEEQLSYWKGQLGDSLPVLEMPTDRARPPVQTFRGAHQSVTLSQSVAQGLKEISQREGATLFMTLLAAWQTLLARYSGQDDILVGSPIANRNRAETEPIIGFFVNTLVLRTNLGGNPTFRELLGRVREVTLGAYAHQDIPFEKLVEELQPERDLSRNPLFQVMFVLQNAPAEAVELPGLRLSTIVNEGSTAKFDLTLGMVDASEGLVGSLEYNTDLFDESTITRLLAHFQNLLEGITADAEQHVSALPLLSEGERHRLLIEWNQTRADYPLELSIHQLFEEQVERTPDNIALVFGDEQLSYRELNRRANQLAHHLITLGVGPEVRVAILMERSLEMLVSVLAVLKAGGAYVPLDPAYPHERLSFMLEDAHVLVLLTEQHLRTVLPQHQAPLLCLDADWQTIASQSEHNPLRQFSADQLAYVIYTSGSTGKPKGVALSHRALSNLIHWQLSNSPLGGTATTLQFTSLSFDVSFQEMFATWCAGETLVLINDHVRRDARELADFLRAQAIERLFLPFVSLEQLADASEEAELFPSSLREIITAGEQLKITPHIESLLSRLEGCVLHNHYGPTESHVVTAYSLRGDPSEWGHLPPIGRPIANTRIYLVDENLCPVPVGVAGELLIAGAGLARGYLEQPQMTAERFIPDPYSERGGERLYRTGDLARYRADGQIEFLGRRDHQVKVRGYRIEVGEIEAVLSEHEQVREAVVVAREEENDKRLVAYLVCDEQLSSAELRGHLRERLPEYMMPSSFVMMEEMPLTPNGKVDRRALPPPEQGRVEAGSLYIAPRTATEEIVAGIWQEVLRVERVGIEDNFFELGGHSLLATQVISRLRQSFQVEIPLRTLFAHPSVSALAASIDEELRGGERQSVPPLRRVSREEELRLSFAQQRLWFLDQLEPGSSFYNIPVAVRLRGALDIPALEQTFSEVVRRHESLRTSFGVIDGEPVQVIAAAEPLKLSIVDLTEMEEQEREVEARERAIEEAQRPFDLSRGPLLRVSLLRLDEEDHVLLLTMHHIISDGWSMGVLIKEVAILYQAFSAGEESPLTELAIQYADFAVWQREWLQGEVLEEQLSYWREQLAGAPPVLELPTDHPRPPVQTFRGAHQSFSLSQSVTEGLKEISQREGATLFMTLLAAWQTLLARYSGQDDILVGSPIANRNRAETEALIGFFVNTLVLRTDLSANPTFRELLKRVREVCLGAYAHQDIPFEKLVEELQPERTLSYSPLFQVMLVLQNTSQESVELPALRLTGVGTESRTTKFDLTLSLADSAEGLSGSLSYNTDLFDKSTITRLLSHFQNLLAGIVADPQQRITELGLLSEGERHQLLVEWNQTQADYPLNLSIHQLFEQQVERTPQAVAVIFNEQQLTYQELNQRANQLAHHLISLGVGPEVRVGILMERSPEMVISLLAILKAGGAYVPFDPSYPLQRLSFMFDHACIKLLLTQQRWLLSLPPHTAQILCFDQLSALISGHSLRNPRPTSTPENLAYVIYTSGSTGKPKGVAITHRSAAVLMHWARETFDAQVLSGVLASTSICFDLSVFEMFAPLSWGGKVILVENVLELARLSGVGEVRLINTVPSAMMELVRGGWVPGGVRVVNLAGEALSGALVERIYDEARGVEKIYNLYGPSEDTTYSTIAAMERGRREAPPIGRPIANTRVYVLGAGLEPVPVGVTGELYIGGEGLARGYLGQAEQTAERFIPDPFGGEVGGRLYRTGDLARYRADGQIEFLGRLDHQVKVRGFRIELGEIEAVLSQHERVREAVVVAREEEGGEGKRLVAYLVCDEQLSNAELRGHLRERLPEYMMPSSFVMMEEMPLTPNGKIDRRALPPPEQMSHQPHVLYIAPRTATEEIVAAIWQEVLRREQVGINENFFELGGHSLLATQVISRLRQSFQVEMPLRTLFAHPSVSALAASIDEELRGGERQSVPPLRRVSREQKLVLSFAQQRLWFLDQLEPGSSFYNIPVAVRLKGALDIPALEQTFSEIIRRHEVLRTTFATVDGEPVQVIAEAEPLSLPLLNLSHLQEAEREVEARERATEEAQRPFDLSRGPLLRVSLLRLDEEDHVLLLTMHHIISDGWSMGVLVREVATLYQAFSEGRPSPLAELPIQYVDFAVWQREWLQGEVLEEQLSYWREQLAGAPPVLELPTDHPRPPVQTFRGAHQSFTLSKSVTEGLKEISQREGATLFMTLLAAWQTLLSRYSGQDDIVIGSPIANRNRAETEALIGFFVNTLVLRTDLRGDPTFRELLKRVREVCLGAYAHQDIPFEKLVEELQPERSLSSTPLFQVMMALQNTSQESVELPALRLSSINGEGSTAKFDLTLSLRESAGGLIGSLEYNTDLFEKATIDRLVNHLSVLLAGIVADPQQRISALPLLSEGERHQLLVEWNQTQADYPHDQSVHHLFEQQVERTPDNIALVFGDEQFSYHELNERANQLAHHLIRLGVRPEVCVAILMERSTEMIISLLAILKAGGAYLPLDPSYPQERLSFMLADAHVRVLLTLKHLAHSVLSYDGTVLCLDSVSLALSAENTHNPASSVHAANLAYIIYTSGSTGTPKGVQVPHRNLLNLVSWHHQAFGVSSTDRASQLAGVSFDASVWELWPYLTAGATLHIADQETPRDAARLIEWMAHHQLTMSFMPTPLAEAVMGQPWPTGIGLRMLLTGGDRLHRAAVGERLEIKVVNNYGPTEATVVATWGEVRVGEQEEPSIGRPIANTRVYVLGAGLEPVGVGVRGELYIGGAGVARGYLGQAEQTAERFIPDPYGSEPGGRLYRTGDLVRYRADGQIEFVGRADEQVKVRGYRIELGEIEAVLTEHERVREAVVVAREEEGGGGKRLVAYLVCDEQLSSAEPRGHLRERLPEYMMPSFFVMMEEMPLTPNGKIDRRALPPPEQMSHQPHVLYIAPRTATEEIVAAIWQEVLRREQVGIDDNFFELGGHSLLATQVISRVRQSFQVEMPLRTLFAHPSVSALAASIDEELRGGERRSVPPLRRVSREQKLVLSFAQQRLWFLDQLEPGSSFYNIPVAVRLKGALDIAALEQTFSEIIRRHEVLRTSFGVIDGQPVQVINPPSGLRVPLIDLSEVGEEEREAEARRLAAEEARRPFDLSSGPLLRVSLLRLSAEDHVLLLTMHHIISDGWSMGVLVREVAILYQALLAGEESPLEELPIQYADFAVWQREWLQGEVLEEQLSYWREQLAGAPPVLEMLTDRARPPVQTFRGAHHPVMLSRSVTEGLKKLGQREGATLFMTLLAAWQTLLARYSNQQDIVVGSPIANRNRAETEGLIGFFVNTLVLRTDLRGAPTFRELLKRVREVCLGAYAHQDIPFEKLVEELQPERSLSSTPLFQVMLVLQNTSQESVELPALRLSSINGEGSTAKFDLTLSLVDSAEGVSGSLSYNTDLFDEATISRLLAHFQNLLEGITADAEQRISELPMLSEGERHQLLVEWNATTKEYPAHTCLHNLFEQQVERTPDHIALVFGDEQLSYHELNERANQLAHHLISLNVGPEARVAILMERSTEMVISLLAILKAGGAYLPLDPSYPQERISFMLTDAKASVILTTQHLLDTLTHYDGTVLCLDADSLALSAHSVLNPSTSVSASNLAYLIYTSGSTGLPKAVAITHRNVLRLVSSHNSYASFSPHEVFLLLAPIAFDASTFELWGALLNGARLVIYPPEMPTLEELAALITEQQVTTLWLTAGLFHQMVEQQLEGLRGVRQLLAGGDVLSVEHVRKVIEELPQTRMINGYGPTEATTFACCHEVRGGELEERVPIGRPIGNTQVYILDREMKLVPVGVSGELYIGGEGVGRGYWNRAELTAERFIPDPFGERGGARLYRTGDLVRYRGDGVIEFLGRLDHQVKVRGFRIEPGEIEAVLTEHERVREAVVVAREEENDKRLVAYLVCDEQLSSAELRHYLRERLPEYMMPAFFVILEQMPLTPNGKVDRRALPAPDQGRSGLEDAFAAPRDILELELTHIWEDVLNRHPVGVKDNFFELGGHSLLAVRLLSQIENKMGRRLPLAIFFQGATVEYLASVLRQQESPTGWPSLVGIQRGGSNTPFFCVHPGGGNVFRYTDLAHHLGPDQPFYGFQAKGINDEAGLETEVEEMAAHYVEELLAVQPEGPYILGGWSMGGIVAFEMCRQLQSQSQEVALLALLDTVVPVLNETHNEENDAALLTGFALDLGLSLNQLDLSLDHLFQLGPNEQLTFILEQARTAKILPPDIGPDYMRRLWRVYKTNAQAQRNYVPRTSPVRIALFKASEQLAQSHDPTLGWSLLAAGGLEVHRVPGNHYTMMREPHVKALAEQLGACINKRIRA